MTTAIRFDAIKAAYRQTKDGYTVTFVIHPQDKHDELMAAPIGSQWNLTAVALDENGNVTDAGDKTVPLSPAREVGAAVQPASRLTRQAGMLCNERLFQVFLHETGFNIRDAESAAVAVRSICGVESRRDIKPGTEAAKAFDDLYGRFVAWRDVPELTS